MVKDTTWQETSKGAKALGFSWTHLGVLSFDDFRMVLSI